MSNNVPLSPQVYAATFFLIPAIRWILNQARNREIQNRNEARQQMAQLLQRPDSTLRAKLQSAAQRAERTVISDKDIVYSSHKDSADQNRDLDADSFDKRLADLDKATDSDSTFGQQQTRNKKALEWQ